MPNTTVSKIKRHRRINANWCILHVANHLVLHRFYHKRYAKTVLHLLVLKPWSNQCITQNQPIALITFYRFAYIRIAVNCMKKIGLAKSKQKKPQYKFLIIDYKIKNFPLLGRQNKRP